MVSESNESRSINGPDESTSPSRNAHTAIRVIVREW